ncbi:MAG: DNA-binding response regulator [Spirochaetaceae bacterium]|nr:MAG: DNA-binding response regulator [Spirochaetaceae bacterium]
MTRSTILIVEDDRKTTDLVSMYLKRDGHRLYTAVDGLSGLRMAEEHTPEVIILDIMLPGMDGLEVCRRIRKVSDAFIIMLTARSTEEDRLRGLNTGADDYLTKPFSPRELAARVQAVLRRAPGRTKTAERHLSACGVTVDLDRYEASIQGTALTLTPAEFRLLATLAAEPGRTFSREQLIQQVFGSSYDGLDRSIDVHIKKLRRKIEPDPQHPTLLKTIYGYGYRFGGDT